MVPLARRLISVPSFISLCASTVLCKCLALYRSISSHFHWNGWLVCMEESVFDGVRTWCPRCVRAYVDERVLVDLEYSVPRVHSGRHFCPVAVIPVNPGPGDIKHSVCVLFRKSCLKNMLVLERSFSLFFSTSPLSNSISLFGMGPLCLIIQYLFNFYTLYTTLHLMWFWDCLGGV